MQTLADRVDVAEAAVLERDEDGQRHAKRQLQEERLVLGERASAHAAQGSAWWCARAAQFKNRTDLDQQARAKHEDGEDVKVLAQ